MRVFLFLMLMIITANAQPQAEDVQTFTLKNGMKILVLEDHSIPNANMYLFFKVGSRNEVPGITGLSHFFEHMMFNGSKKYGPKMFDRVMEANGGSNNAYTSENLTVYTDWFPVSSMEVMFDLESDRMANLNFDEKMIESERGVVLSERTTSLENSNWRTMNEQVKSVAFMAHPYRWSVIGYESDIKSWTKEDLQNYFKTYYAPNNCVAVFVGDIQPEQVKKLAQQYFEPIPGQQPPAEVRTVEPEQKGEKRLLVQKNVSSPNILIAWHIPQTSADEYYALSLLEAVLSSGKSSRLYSQVVFEKQLASDVFTHMPFSMDPNLFYIYAVAARDAEVSALEDAIYAQIDDIVQNGIEEKELEKVKNQKLVEFYRTMETINGKADNLGTYELYFGDYKKLFNAPEDFSKVSAADIQKVAAKYFIKRNRTVGILQTNVD